MVVSIFVHRERVGEGGIDQAKPAAVETAQAAPRSPTHSHPHPQDLEEEMIEEDYRRRSVEQVQSQQQPEGHDASQVDHIEQRGERVEGHDNRVAGQHFNIEA